VYVHGATFSSDLSVFYKFDKRSWADALTEASFNTWGFDFVGYGRSSRYDKDSASPRGRVVEAALQLESVMDHIYRLNGGKQIHLVAHSWGTLVAARYASEHPGKVKSLVLFGPPVVRDATDNEGSGDIEVAPSHHLVSALAQYRRFIEDVPRAEPQVLSEVHFEAWSQAWLQTDAEAKSRAPAAVLLPFGPIADLVALWSGEWLFDAARIKTPTLLVRGDWDSVCDDNDAARLLSQLGAVDKTDLKIPRATHLMHLELQRCVLHSALNMFLQRIAKEE
jgi:pimeloyl-ACP methyl ester carboxylesterase